MFFIRVFFYRHRRFTERQGKEGDHLLFHPITFTCSQTFRDSFATLHVRWLSRSFNRNACIYKTATRWHSPSYWITIWSIDWWCNVCLFVYLMIWFSVFVTAILNRKPVNLNSHRLSQVFVRVIVAKNQPLFLSEVYFNTKYFNFVRKAVPI